jgi:hypothetical protein
MLEKLHMAQSQRLEPGKVALSESLHIQEWQVLNKIFLSLD